MGDKYHIQYTEFLVQQFPELNVWGHWLVMCKYSKFRIESVFDSIRNEYKYSKFLNTYRHQFLTYLNRMTPIFHLRNHA